MTEALFNIEAAIDFVKKNGESFEYSFLNAMANKKYIPEFTKNMMVYQNQDGGWTRMDPDYKGNVSSISCSLIALSKFNSVGIEESCYEKTLNYLRRTQKEEGYWDESEEVMDSHPPRWFYPNNPENHIWFTNGVVRYLTSLRCKDHQLIKRAKAFLRRHWKDQSFKGYRHNNWMGAVTFSEEEMPIDTVIKNQCLNNLWNDAESYDLFDLLWAMESLISLNKDMDDPIVQRFYRLIQQKKQLDDGGFETEFGEQHRVELANKIIFTYLKLGLITTDDLKVKG